MEAVERSNSIFRFFWRCLQTCFLSRIRKAARLVQAFVRAAAGACSDAAVSGRSSSLAGDNFVPHILCVLMMDVCRAHFHFRLGQTTDPKKGWQLFASIELSSQDRFYASGARRKFWNGVCKVCQSLDQEDVVLVELEAKHCLLKMLKQE